MLKKTLATVIAVGLVAGAFAAPPAAAKKKKKKPPAACAAYVPGELGAAAPTVVLTDTATEAAPVVQKIELGESIGDISQGIGADEAAFLGATQAVFNVQVDSANPTAGLYVLVEFPERRDYDLWLRWPSGVEAASSHGFNPAIEANFEDPVFGINPSNTSTNHAGESTASSEKVVGVITPDCGGYTIDVQNWLGEGGEFEVKVWLGEGTTEPKPDEAPPE